MTGLRQLPLPLAHRPALAADDFLVADSNRAGGSNFAFVDGSVRYLKFGASVNPLNLWAVSEDWRNAAVKPDDLIKK